LSFYIDIRKPAEDIRYFGQTFLLDIVKTEQINNDHNQYIRPTISDHNALVAVDTNSSVSSSEHIPGKSYYCDLIFHWDIQQFVQLKVFDSTLHMICNKCNKYLLFAFI
jgi:hypothetical protein